MPQLDTKDYEMTTEISFKIMPSISDGGKQPKYEIDWERAENFGVNIGLLGLVGSGTYYLILKLLEVIGALTLV